MHVGGQSCDLLLGHQRGGWFFMVHTAFCDIVNRGKETNVLYIVWESCTMFWQCFLFYMICNS